jgi:hypothetical protein
MIVIVFEFGLSDANFATEATPPAFNPTGLYITKITYDARMLVKRDRQVKPINIGGAR